MKYELWVHLEKNDTWFKAMSSSNVNLIEAKKKKLLKQGHKVKESVNYMGVNNV